MACCSRKCRFITFGVLALVFLVLGASFQAVIYAIVRDVVNDQVPLS